MHSIGKMLIVAGLLLAACGLLFIFFDKVPFLGKLPGDFTLKRKNFTLYFPLATSLIISILLSLIVKFMSRR